MQNGTPKVSFQGIFLPKVVLSQKRSFQLKYEIHDYFAETFIKRLTACPPTALVCTESSLEYYSAVWACLTLFLSAHLS